MLASNGGPNELGEIGGAEVGEPHGREGGLEGGTRRSAGGEAFDDVGVALEGERGVGSGTRGEARRTG